MNLIGEGPGGHSPAWHGAAPGAATEGNPGQANAAALSGIKSQEFGGRGHSTSSTASSVGDTTVPHLAAPHIALVGQAGVGLRAGQDVHLSSQGATTVASGQDSHWAVGSSRCSARARSR